jgi:TonB family protein
VATQHLLLQTRTGARPASGALVDVVVLSPDAGLFQAIRDAVGERNPVWRARSAEEAVDLLLTGRCGVLLVDMASVSTNPGSLIEQIRDQFPDVVTLVAGRKDDESLLARLISDGLVYRFMHKPLSPKRAGMFLNAAVRHYVEQCEEPPGESLLALGPGLAGPTGRTRWTLLACGLALLVAAAVLLIDREEPVVSQPRAPGATPPGATVAAPRQADPVLASARAALAAERYESPPGRNALDLYRAVLLARPDNPEAQDGLEKTITAILAQAERQRADGDAAAAQRLVDRVLAANPDHREALRVAAELRPARPPLNATAADAPPVKAPRPAAASPVAGRARAPVVAAPANANPSVADPDRAAPSQIREPPVVRPDPLLSTQTQRAARPPAGAAAVPMQAPGSFGGPISSGHPTAGVEDQPPAAVQTETAAAASGDRAFAIAAPLQALGELERLHAPDPVYPPQALRDGVEGWVELEFTVTETGAVGDVLVLDSKPGGVFERAAIEAVASWRFRPRTVNGRPVQQRSNITIRFEVED